MSLLANTGYSVGCRRTRADLLEVTPATIGDGGNALQERCRIGGYVRLPPMRAARYGDETSPFLKYACNARAEEIEGERNGDAEVIKEAPSHRRSPPLPQVAKTGQDRTVTQDFEGSPGRALALTKPLIHLWVAFRKHRGPASSTNFYRRSMWELAASGLPTLPPHPFGRTQPLRR